VPTEAKIIKQEKDGKLVNKTFNKNKLASKDRAYKIKSWISALERDVLPNIDLPKRDFYVLFFSICDKGSRALVFKGTGKTINEAWDNGANNLKAYLSENSEYDLVWIKVDVVDKINKIELTDLNKRIVEGYFSFFYRKGLAFDENFDTAFLEGEINGNKMLTYYTEKEMAARKVDHSSNRLNLENINNYLTKYYAKAPIRNIPTQIFEFNTQAFFSDGKDNVYPLYNVGHDTGRRLVAETTGDIIKEVITKASTFLNNEIMDDGKFNYGYFPVFGNKMKNYNILRHTSSLWSLINLYRMTKDETVLSNLDLAIKYMIDGYIEYRDKDTAFLVEHEANEIKLGGNGVACIMLTEYMDILDNDKHMGLVRALANGIITMQNPNGAFVHILDYPSFKLKEEYRTVYYDGEAVFGLTRAYSLTKDEKYLEAAKRGIDNLIDKNYVTYRDHWVAYAFNEITKYIPDPRYFEFAMRNVKENLKGIYKRETSFHTYLELLVISWQTYERWLASGVDVDYMNEFNVEHFAQTIYRRARHMLNGFFYPELAMYMKYPEQIVDGFMVRHHSFRTRIDDIQHFIGGYYYYTVYYDKIRAYLSEDFLSRIDS